MSKANPGARGGTLTRRHILKSAAAGAGLGVGSGLIRGFPTVWAQNVKDVTLVHMGGSYSAIKEIGEQAGKDLGFKVVMQAVDPETQLSRSLTQPKTVDINDIPTTTMPYLVGKGVLQPVPLVIQSMWSPAVTAVRSRGIPCYYVPLKEGYRGWTIMLAPMAHLTGLKLDCALEYMNWFNSGWQGGFIAKQGYYSSVPSNAKKFLTKEEWDFWYEGKPAAVDIKDPYGQLMEKKGAVRDGGALWDRMGNIACWNTVMQEDRYLTRRWNEFVSS